MTTMRRAGKSDVPAIRSLIGQSSRELASHCYDPELIELALDSLLGVDQQLIIDGTYYVVETAHGMVGCGGWSFRKTLFGSDSVSGRDDRELDPETEAARIRAFFVHPEHARKGIATRILKACENDAREMGFRRLALGATLSGVAFYRASGFRPDAPVQHRLPGGRTMEIVPMRKTLA